MTNLRLRITTLLFMVALPAGADSAFPISGRLFGDVYAPTQKHFSGRTLMQTSAGLWLQVDHSFNDDISARFIGEGYLFDGNNSIVTGRSAETHVEGTIREGYFNYFKNGLDLKIGRLITPWGKSDVFNPTDYLSAKNYAFLNPDDEVRRIGGAGLMASITPNEGSSPWNFTLVANPYFPKSKFLLSQNVLPANVTLQGVQEPGIGADTLETAARVSYAGEGWDGSVSWFRGYNHLPELREISHALVGATVIVNLTQVFHRRQSVGLDGSYLYDKWIFRLESAYNWTENDDGTQMDMQPTHHDTVFGVERAFGENFRLQGQCIVRYYPRFTGFDQIGGSDPVSIQVNRSVARANALLLNYQEAQRSSSTFRAAYSDDAKIWEAEVFYLHNFIGSDYLVRPKVSYAVTDTIKATAGVDIYGGAADRPLGALNPYNSVFVEGRYSF